MSLLCSCDAGANGFGLIDCYGQPDRVVAYGFQQLKDGNSENYLTAPLLQAGWNGALYNKSGAVRISVLRNAKQVTDEREDPVTETIDTVDAIIRDGKRMITFTVVGVPSKIIAYINSLRCQNIGFYGISAANQLLGRNKETIANALHPIPVEKGTIYAKEIPKTTDTFQKVMVTFQVAENYDDSQNALFPSDVVDADLLDTPAMIQANAITTGATTTTATTQEIQLNFALSGQVGSTEPLENFGSVTGNIAIYNETTAAVVATASFTESATTPGLYTVSFTAQTTADVLRFSAGALAPFNFTAFTKTAL
jgi:hypothetical protein